MKHPVLPRGEELGLPLASGVLLALCFPPFHLLIPPFVALVPYLIFLGSCPADRSGSTSAARATFWMGIVYYGIVLYWLAAALVFFTWLALLGYLITVVVLAGLLALVGYSTHSLRYRHRLPFWAILPLFWTGVEWLRGHLGDVAFPWLGLGHSLTGFPALVGFADVAGARGVTFWLAAINGLLAEWWLEGLRARWRRWATVLLLVVAIPAGYSLFKWATLQTRPAAHVLVVQPNIPEELKLDRDAAADSSRIALGRLTTAGLAEAPGVELVVWPETALPNFPNAERSWTVWAATLARDNDVALLYGTLDLERHRDGGYSYYNSALYLSAEGNRAGLYRKHFLVPIVERVPFIPLSWTRSLRRSAARGMRLPLIGDVGVFFRWFGGFGRGTDKPVFPVGEGSFGVLICYESIFAAHSRAYRRAGAAFLVNITNDAWFGRERPWWSRTSALVQHPAHLVMRAIENRVGIVRAANTGISMLVDPRGRILKPTRLFEAATRAGVVETTDELTVYARVGDWVGWLCGLGAAVLFLSSWWLALPRFRRRLDS
ncbi:MAG: apolipoprotein N-acyltransferase [Gemmatimonadota bacterium]